jgi:squalene-hopene/tetraprenyl-beta-curcumene cyclase
MSTAGIIPQDEIEQNISINWRRQATRTKQRSTQGNWTMSIRCAALAALFTAFLLDVAGGADRDVERRKYEQMVAKAISYLEVKGQAEDGSFSSVGGPGITALVTTAILQHGRSPDEPFVAKSLKYLEGFVQPDGGIYQTETFYKNYETCLAILCFNAANKDGRYNELIKRADGFVRKLQWNEDEGKDKSDFAYGGQGYGKNKRADLSNTSFFVDAVKALGAGADDEAIQQALIFVSRCQNKETEHNTTPHSSKNPDGGFYYTPDGGGYSQAGTTVNGGLRSYGSMTYAGLKSMIYAGVGPDDPRVKAATEWIQKNYDLKSNPGMGSSGLYYYYHTFAKALDAVGQDTFTDGDGKQHDWRAELRAELAARQQKDGSWINEDARWLEGDPNLVTGYALLTLTFCKPK